MYNAPLFAAGCSTFFKKITADRCRCLLGWLVGLGVGGEIEAADIG